VNAQVVCGPCDPGRGPGHHDHLVALLDQSSAEKLFVNFDEHLVGVLNWRD